MTRTWGLGPFAALALLLVFLVGSAHASGVQYPALTTDPKSLALTQADVTKIYGAGYTRVFGMVVSNKDVSGVSGTPSLSGSGRVTGYATEFIGSQGTVLIVANGINLYRTSIQARAAVHAVLTHKGLAGIKSSKLHAATLQGVGDTAFVVTFNVSNNPGKPGGSALILGFSRGPYAADIYLAGRGKPDLARALALAKIQDQHMQHG